MDSGRLPPYLYVCLTRRELYYSVGEQDHVLHCDCVWTGHLIPTLSYSMNTCIRAPLLSVCHTGWVDLLIVNHTSSVSYGIFFILCYKSLLHTMIVYCTAVSILHVDGSP